MPKFSPLQSNFSGGEFSPFMEGRVEFDRYKQSVRTCLNFIPMLQGPLSRRSGTEYVSNTKNNGVARLQSFNFSTTQAYMLELGHQYIRFYKEGGLITFTPKNITAGGITQANPAVVNLTAHGFSNGDFVTIEGVSGMTQVNNRNFKVANVAANTFEIQTEGAVNINSTGFDAYVSGGTAAKIFELPTIFAGTDVFDLKFCQSEDVLYIAHGSYKPKKLLRYSHTDWQIVDLDLQDGPYDRERVASNTNTKLKPSAATGTGVTLTAETAINISGAVSNGHGQIRLSCTAHDYITGEVVYVTGVTGTTEANGYWTITTIDDDTFDLRNSVFTNAYVAGGTTVIAPFVSTDVGRLVRMKEASSWGYARITAYTDQTQVTITVVNTFTNANSKGIWRLGLYSIKLGYPSSVIFHEDRLCFGGPQQNMNGSVSGDYENFAPTEKDATVSPDNAISFVFNSNDVNNVEWLTSDEQGLLAGTAASEWLTRPSSSGEALSPSNITAKKSTGWGSESIQPVQAGKATIFVQKSGRKIREMNYDFYTQGFRANDLTQLANHISPTGIKQMAYQKEPQGIVWCVRNDGVLAGMTYDRDTDALRVGWHRHVLGGASDAAGNSAIAESAQVLISDDNLRDDLWLIAKRYINGVVVRHVEILTKNFDETTLQRDAFFVDAGLTYDSPKAITGGVTKANPAVVSLASHGFSNGDKILITGVEGMIELNGNTYLVASAAAGTFALHDSSGNAIVSTNFGTYVSGGHVRKLVTTISGLNHLEGQTVSILADGSVRPNQVVTKGIITLADPAGTIHIGLKYNSDGQLLRVEGGSAEGTALGKTRRIQRVGINLFRTLGLKIGLSFGALDVITFRKTSDPLTRAPALFSGIKSEVLEADYDFENYFCFRQDQPLPCTILSIMPQLVEQDR